MDVRGLGLLALVVLGGGCNSVVHYHPVSLENLPQCATFSHGLRIDVEAKKGIFSGGHQTKRLFLSSRRPLIELPEGSRTWHIRVGVCNEPVGLSTHYKCASDAFQAEFDKTFDSAQGATLEIPKLSQSICPSPMEASAGQP
ncbi:MAG: hypothetical protein ACPG4T_10200 [Nannocystaceae bacterium]